jgi:uncharacterized protein (DUF302 family)
MSAVQGIETVVQQPMAEAEAAVRAALAEEGFGVLTEIDVAATLKAKLDVDRPPLKILGACNPSLADQALGIDPTIALVLPCNVVVEQQGTGTKVSALDPHALVADERFGEFADEVAARLRRAIAALGGSAPG